MTEQYGLAIAELKRKDKMNTEHITEINRRIRSCLDLETKLHYLDSLLKKNEIDKLEYHILKHNIIGNKPEHEFRKEIDDYVEKAVVLKNKILSDKRDNNVAISLMVVLFLSVVFSFISNPGFTGMATLIVNASVSSDNNNWTTGNITATWASGDAVNITDWRINGRSIAVMNLPFENTSVWNDKTLNRTRDYSTFNNTAYVMGDPKLLCGSLCKSGCCYNFTGTEYINLSKPTSMLIMTGLTVEFWMWSDVDQSNTGIVGPNVDPNYPFYTIVNPTNYLTFRVYDENDGAAAFQSTGAYTKSAWHLVDMVWNGTTLYAYVDGVKDANTGSTPRGGSTYVMLYDQLIGRYVSSTYSFKGKLDDIKIYDRPLTPEQILLHNASKYNKLASNMLSEGDIISIAVTSNDLANDGNTTYSNELVVLNNGTRTYNNSIYTDIGKFKIPSNIFSNFTVYDPFGSTIIGNSTVFKINNYTDPVFYMSCENNSLSPNKIYWKDYSSSDIKIASVNLTLKSRPQYTPGGKVGGGCYFDGDGGSFDFGFSPQNQCGNEMTVELWINETTNDNYQGIFARFYDGGAGSSTFLLYKTGSAEANRYAWITYAIEGGITVQSPVWMANSLNGTWAHLVATYRNNTVAGSRIYVNGVQVANGTTVGLSTLRKNLYWPFTIGRYQSAQFFNGTLDEIRMYCRVLSDQEILDHNATNYNKLYSAQVPENSTVQSCNIANSVRTQGPASCSQGYKFTSLPSISNVILNSTLGTNFTTENLTVYFTANSSVTNITDWRRNGTSIAVLNMPFEVDGRNNGTDYSMYGNNVTTISSAAWASNGKIGGAYNFSGTSYLSIPDATSLKLNNSISIDAWIYPTSTTGTIVAKGRTTAESNGNYILRFISGNLQFYYHDGGSFHVYSSTSAVVTTNKWQNVGVTYTFGNGSSVKLYYDGVVAGGSWTGTGNTYPAASTQPLYIGRIYGGFEPFAGLIDEVKIYNRSLSADEMLFLNVSRTDILANEELNVGDVWSAAITPNDGTTDGTTVISNNVTIKTTNVAPVVSNVILNSTIGTNYTTENLTVYYNATDAGGDSVFNTTDWRINGNSLAVLNMPFENSSTSATNVKDYSTYGNNGTITGAIWTSSGKYGAAYVFNGATDYINISNSTGSTPATFPLGNSSRTVTMWIKSGALTGQKTLLMYGNPSVNNMFLIYLNSGTMYVNVYGYEWSSGTTSTPGTWEHWAFTYQGTNVTVYKNGTQVYSTTVSQFNTLPGVNNWIGKYGGDGASWLYNGTIDEFKIYNRTLTSQQITNDYNNGKDKIVSQELRVGDIWSAAITPNDGTQDGTTVLSNNVTIVNAMPVVSNVILNSTLGTNYTNENLTVYYTATDADNNPVFNITDWRRNGESLAHLNMFGRNNSLFNAGKMRDYSVYNMNTTKYGVALHNVGGYFGQAYKFDGNVQNFSVVTQNDALNFTRSFTAELVFNNTCVACTARILSKWGGGYAPSSFVVGFGSSNQISFALTDGSNAYSYAVNNVVYDNRTHYVAATFNSTASASIGTVKIYVDGLQVGNWSNFPSNTMHVGSDNLYISGTQETSGSRFSGYLYMLKLWNVTLSQEQILLHNATIFSQISSGQSYAPSTLLNSGDKWTSCITPNDGLNDGTTICSDNLTVRTHPPMFSNITLNSTFGTNLTTENLTVYYNTSDADNDTAYNITDWRINGTSIMLLNMPFEANSNSANNATDYSTFNNTGGVNGAIWTSSGKYGGAYTFDATRYYYIRINDATDFDFNDFTYSAWVYPTMHTQGLYQTIFDLDNNKQWFGFYNDNLTLYGRCGTVFNIGAVDINSWQHVVWTVNGSSYRVYKNGVLVKSGNGCSSGVDTDRFYIGSDDPSYQETFNGTIDEVLIFNRSLSEEEILLLNATNHNTISEKETNVGDVWSAAITPNDGTQDGLTVLSNNVTILNTAPVISNVTINSTFGMNLTTENLTVYWNSTDVDGGPVVNVTDWRINGNSFALVNIPFEKGSSNSVYLDYSTYKNNATVMQGNAQSIMNGVNGGAVYCNGSASSTLSLGNFNFDTQQNWTVDFWVNSSASGGFLAAQYQQAVIENVSWRFYDSGTTFDFCILDTAHAFRCITSPTVINVWKHLTGTFDNVANVSKFYVDGVFVGNQTTFNVYAPHSVTAPITICSAWGGFYLTGFIDEFKIFNRTLSPEEILLLNSSRNDVVSSKELKLGDVWSAAVTPNDGYGDGTTVFSNNLTILNNISLVSFYPNQTGQVQNITTETSTALTKNKSATTNLTFNVTVRTEVAESLTFSWFVNQVVKFVQTVASGFTSMFSMLFNTGGQFNVSVVVNGSNPANNKTFQFNLSVTNIQPVVSNVTLNSTFGTNLTTENLTVYYNMSDDNGDSIINITDWRLNGTSIMLLNMPFEANSNSANNATDYSTFNNTGGVSEATWTSNGKYGGAYAFDGSNDMIETANADSGNGSFSVSVWADISTMHDNYGVVVASTDSGGGGDWMIYKTAIGEGNVMRWLVEAGPGSPVFCQTPSYTTGWHHYVGIYQPTAPSVKFYVDGIDQSISFCNWGGAFPRPVNTKPISIGSHFWSGAYANFFNGTIDEINIFNHSLSYEEILLLNATNHNTISEKETNVGDVWSTAVTPNDGTTDGTTVLSNNVTILNTAPVVSNVILNSTLGTNYTDENLTVYYNSTDVDDGSIVNITDWRINGTSMAVLNMPFEGGSNSTYTKDYSTYGNNGTVFNSPNISWCSSCGYDGNGAYSLSGNLGYIRANSFSFLSNQTTISMWTNCTNSSAPYQPIFVKSSGSNNRVDVGFSPTCSNIYPVFSNGTGSNNGLYYTADYHGWHNTIITVNQTHLQLYRDGAVVITSTYSADLTGITANLLIGFRWGSEIFNGTLDNYQVYNGALSPEQILLLYNNRTDVISDKETYSGQNWSMCVTPNDGFEDGVLNCSNNLFIRNIINFTSVYPNNTGAVQPITNEINISLVRNHSMTTNLTFNVSVNVTDTQPITFSWFVNQVLAFWETLTSGFTSMFSFLFTNVGKYNVTVVVNGSGVNQTFTFLLNTTNVAPVMNSVFINSTYGANSTWENLTAYWNASDYDNDTLYNITNWRVNGTSITLLYAPFEGGSNSTWAKDYSGYGSNGTIYKATYNSTGGYNGGGAYQFAGNKTYINWGSASSLDNLDNFSIAVRINSKDLTHINEIFQKSLMRLYVQTGGYIYFYKDYTTTDALFYSSAFMSPNTWYHIVVTLNNGVPKMYVDGTEKISIAAPSNGTGAATNDASLNWLMGMINDGYWFNGTIDDLRVYKRVLTPNEVKLLNASVDSTIHMDETNYGDRWSACITPNDGYADGLTSCSNNVTILNTAPVVSNVILNSTLGTNYTDENLTVYYNSTDVDDGSIVNITDWRINGTSMAVLNMPFEANSNSANNATDYSTNNNTGSVLGVTWKNNCKYGGCYNYDSTAKYISIPDSVALSPADNLTVSFWVNESASLTMSPIITKWTYATQGTWGIRKSNNGLYLFVFIANALNDAGNNYCAASESVTWTAGVWHHIVMVFNGSGATNTDKLKLYIDGVSSITSCAGTIPSTLTDSNAPIVLGAWPGLPAIGYFYGQMDELKQYNRVLSYEEILLLNATNHNTISEKETKVGENWSAAITPNDGTADGTTVLSNNLTIRNKAPDAPTLITPNNGNDTLTNLTVFLKWNASSDIDGDSLTYDVNITSQYCANQFFSPISNLNYTTPDLSTVDVCGVYFWKVRAYDGTSYGDYSSTYNFSIQPMINIFLTQNVSDFGNMIPGETNDTADEKPKPFIVQSDSNVLVNVSVRALNALWNNSGLGNNTFRYKARENVTGAFNITNSQMTYRAITGSVILAVNKLKFQDQNDTAKIDFEVTAPGDEPAGAKSSSVTIQGAQS